MSAVVGAGGGEAGAAAAGVLQLVIGGGRVEGVLTCGHIRSDLPKSLVRNLPAVDRLVTTL